LLSIRSTPCEVGDILGMDATPVPFRLDQSPLAAVLPRQASPSIALSRYRWSFMVNRARLVFSAIFTLSRPVFLTLRYPSVDGDLTTLLSIALSRCRPATCSVCTLPLPLRAGKCPLAAYQPAPGSYFCASSTNRLRVSLSADHFPRCVSGSRSQAFTSRLSGPS